MTLRCYLFGHDVYEHDDIEKCARCHKEVDGYYGEDWTFHQRYGVIKAVWYFIVSVRYRLFPCCCNCGKSLWFGRRWKDSPFCSEQCAEECIPF